MSGKLKIIDFIIIALIIVAVVIFGLKFYKKVNFAKLPIEKEAKIQFDVFFRGVTISDTVAPFNVGDDAFITIRNVPYTKLKIVGIDGRPRMTVVPSNNEVGYVVAQDVSTPDLYDFIIRLEDNAKKTPDGYVAGGNKIKMGIPVVIEGEKYKYTGTISHINEVDEAAQTQQAEQK